MSVAGGVERCAEVGFLVVAGGGLDIEHREVDEVDVAHDRRHVEVQRRVDVGQDCHRKLVVLGTERVLELADQGREFFFVLVRLGVDFLAGSSDRLLERIPSGADARADLLRLDLRELIGQVQAVEVVGLDQIVRAVDERDSRLRGLQQAQVLVWGVLRVTADAEKNLQAGELPLQLSGGSEGRLTCEEKSV